MKKSRKSSDKSAEIVNEEYLRQFFVEEDVPLTSLRRRDVSHKHSLAEKAIGRFRETYRQRVCAISS